MLYTIVKRNRATLCAELPPGTVLRYIPRLRTQQRRLAVIDLRSELAPFDPTIAQDVAALIGWPYLYSRQGIALQGSQSPEDLVAALARTLHGDPLALTVLPL